MAWRSASKVSSSRLALQRTDYYVDVVSFLVSVPVRRRMDHNIDEKRAAEQAACSQHVPRFGKRFLECEKCGKFLFWNWDRSPEARPLRA
jgi:hypothetical protein